MGRVLARVFPGVAVVAAATTVTLIALRTLARWRGERDWAEAWEAYRERR